MYMKALLEKLLEENQENGVPGVECQVHFKTSSLIPTLKGAMASSAAAGLLRAGPVEGIFVMLSKGEGPNREPVMAEVMFEAEQVARVERLKVGEAPRIVGPNGPMTVPRVG